MQFQALFLSQLAMFLVFLVSLYVLIAPTPAYPAHQPLLITMGRILFRLISLLWDYLRFIMDREYTIYVTRLKIFFSIGKVSKARALLRTSSPHNSSARSLMSLHAVLIQI